jgi:GT2 family glycosyltransferase
VRYLGSFSSGGQDHKVTPLVYILIANWNGKVMTLECLESLRSITYRPCRTLVIDNASRDGSPEAIARAHPEVELLVQEHNLRYAGAMNAGMRHALAHGAEFVLVMNNDVIVDRGLVSALVAAAQKDPTVGLVAPKILYHTPPTQIWYAGGKISFWTGTMWHVGIRERDCGQYEVPGPTEYATGCCVLARRALIERVGMLDESYYIYAEDADWSVRAHRAGVGVVYEPAGVLWHRVSISTGGNLSFFKLKNKFRGNLRFFARYASWYHWLVFPWLSLAANAWAMLTYLLRRRT